MTMDQPMKLNPGIERVWTNIFGPADGRREFRTLLVISVLLFLQVSPYWLPTPDAAAYLSIARSLAAGEGLTRYGSPHLFYAPGYPIAIAPVFFVFGRSFLALSVAHWCFLVLFLFGTYVWAKRVAPAYALSVALLSAANVGVLYYFRRTLSEAVFMPLLMWSAVALNKLADRRPGDRGWMLPLAFLAVAYLCLVRQAGLALPLGFGCLMLRQAFQNRTRWPWAVLDAGIVGAGALLATGGLVFYDRTMALAAGAEPTYVGMAFGPDATLSSQLFSGLHLRIQEVGRLLVPGAFRVYGDWLNPCMLLYVPLFAAVCLGCFRLARATPDALCFAFPLYLALYLLWPYEQGCRFMTPFVPLLWLSLVALLSRLAGHQRLMRIIVWMVPLTVITALVYLAKDFADSQKLDRHWVSLDAICRQVPAGETLGALLTSQPQYLMLQVRRDLPVLRLRDASDIAPELRFILADTNVVVPPGFARSFGCGDIVLLQRSPAHARNGAPLVPDD